jgi:acetyltransferase-like isoleucine patch superfamily enzyme
MIASDVSILSLVHHFASSAIPMIRQGRQKHVNSIIEDDVWIGTKAVVLPGIHIAKGCIIGRGDKGYKTVRNLRWRAGAVKRKAWSGHV